MLDLQFIRENPELVKQAAQHKQLNPTVVDRVLAMDEARRQLITEVENIRRQINQNVQEIKQAPDARPTEEQIAKGRELKAQLQDVEPQLKQLEEAFQDLLLQVPNVPATDVPIGKDETENQVINQIGELPTFSFEPKPHHELMEALDMLDVKHATKIGGFRSYFLKNDGVMLEQSLLNYAMRMMIKQGFTPMTAPILVNDQAMTGTGYFPWGHDDHYRTQDGQVLAGTSEVALTSYYMDETLTEKDLPIKMVGISPCFRREVGSYGKDTQGIIRVHQFNKVEQVVYTTSDEEETRAWHQRMVGFSEQLLQDLQLPYQILLMCTGDMGAGQRKKYDIETWFPSQNKYRETHSASYFNDFQARRLNIRYRAKDGSTKYVYTLNNTVAATPRLLAAVVENYQQADGSVKVPEVLVPLMGKDVIKAV